MICWICAGISFWGAAGMLAIAAAIQLAQAICRSPRSPLDIQGRHLSQSRSP